MRETRRKRKNQERQTSREKYTKRETEKNQGRAKWTKKGREKEEIQFVKMGPEERQPGQEPGMSDGPPLSPSGQNRTLGRGWAGVTGGGVWVPDWPPAHLSPPGAFTFSQGLGRRQQGLRGSHTGSSSLHARLEAAGREGAMPSLLSSP